MLLLSVSCMCNAKVSQHVADSLAQIINKVPAACDASCALYNQEHPGVSLTNTIFIGLLLIFGAIWLYYTYKKKYVLITGSLLAIIVVGSYFVRPLLASKEVPADCPIVLVNQTNSQADTTFVSPGSEFEQVDSVEPTTDSTTIKSDFTQTTDEFTPASKDEFSTQETLKNQTTNIETSPLNKMSIYEPIAIFIVLGIISYLIRFSWFRKIRGLILLTGLAYFGFYRGACPCMISGFQNSALALMGIHVPWESTLWFLILIPATYLFGKVWCGWLCHLGALQEFLFHSKIKLLASERTQQVLKIVRISVLIVWLLQLLITQTNIFCKYDPFKSAFNLIAADWIGYTLLALLIISSVLIYRPFCRTICPVGLILGWTTSIPGAKKLIKNEQCINCTNCSNECKQKAMIYENKKTTLRTQDCISCGECIGSCKKNALHISRIVQKDKVLFFLAIILLSFPSLAKAQWECPSRLGGSLKPFGSSNLMWAGELTTSGGFIGSEGIANAMLFGGLDYSVNHNTFYIEGSVKSWYRWSDNRGNNNSAKAGLREAFYKYSNDNQELVLGLQSTRSDDYFMINERMIGANYRLSIGNIDFNLLGGSVLKEFARNGTFCTLGYLYNIIPARNRAILGKDFGQTNLSMLSATWRPGKNSGDEFSSNDGLSADKQSPIGINSAGAFIYHEFGNWTTYNTFHSGIYSDINFYGLSLKPEVILQSGNNNNALFYSFGAEKQLIWDNGQQTRLMGRYVGMKKIDNSAVATMSFSNIFAGEVLRLDAMDMPFLQAGIKHSFTNWKASIKLQGALQTGEATNFTPDDYNTTPSKMEELDLTFSKNIGKLLLINATVGYLNYPELSTDSQALLKYKTDHSAWGKVELRLTF